MKVRAITTFRTRSGEVPAGHIFDITPAMLPKLEGLVEPLDLYRMVGEALAEVDRYGRPWPARFLVDMPATDRDRLRELEAAIDQSVLTGDTLTLPSLLTEWRALLLRRLH